MKLVVLSDFDGTVTLNDTFEKCVRQQGGMVQVPSSEILSYLDGVTKFRPNFDKLIEFCMTNHFPLVIVSAGLDFVIKHFLTREKFQDKVELVAASAKCTPTGIKFEWPKLRSDRSMNLKDDMVRYYKRRADRVAYVGDGRWDLHALRNADRRFVIRNSKLAELCLEQEIQATRIIDFQEVVKSLQKEMSERDS